MALKIEKPAKVKKFCWRTEYLPHSVTVSSDPSAQSLLLSHFWAWGIHWSSSQVNIPSGQTGPGNKQEIIRK